MTAYSRYRLKFALLTLLALAPIVFLCGVGMYHLWDREWSFIAYWPMALCWLVAYLLGWYWTRRSKSAGPAEPLPDYWTDRDKEAWQLVAAHADAVPMLTTEQFGDLNRYAADAQELALKVARVYHPMAADPFGHLTLPEILACGELVAHDLTGMVNSYIPGSHLMTVNDIKRVRSMAEKAIDWYPRLRNLYWVASAFFNPLKTGMQVAATKMGLGPAAAGFQQNILLWFYTSYLRELGRHLIELNSGRLKVGAKRYLELMEQHTEPPIVVSEPTNPTTEESAVLPVSLAIVGPVKAGKSTLVNALLGEQKAATDVLPLTPGVTKYDLRQPGRPALTLLDTAGFGNDGASETDVKAAVEAARQADLMMLVVPARSAARKPESEFLDRVRAVFAAQPNLKMPPVVLVVSRIDQLTPAIEWAPPYDWAKGTRPKEVSIRESVESVREVFAGRMVGLVPVCAAPGKECGVRDELLAAVASQLGEARGVGLLRALYTEATVDQTKRVFHQVLNAGGQVLKILWEQAKK